MGKRAAVIALTAVLAGCSATGGYYPGPTASAGGPGTIDYVPQNVEPKSCKDLRRFDSRLAQQRARGNNRISQSLGRIVTGALLGNEKTRGAGVGALGGAVVDEVLTNSQRNAARAQLQSQCERDLAALRQPGGACSWEARVRDGAPTINGLPTEAPRGRMDRNIECEGVGANGRAYDPNF